jgi:hypothetical protein
MNVTINPESGWFASLPKATQDFVMRKLLKAQTDPKRPINLRVTGAGVMREHFTHTPSQARLGMADDLGRKMAREMRHVTPWRGASEGR